MTQETADQGMRTFTIIWFGQLISFIGSGLTQFALSVWVFQKTNSITLFGLILLFSTLPGILLFPITGALIDRWDRRIVLILSDSVAALATLSVIALLFTGQLAVWHIYVATAVISTASSFQYPAFSASVTLLVPQKKLGRAGGMMQFNEATMSILAPLLAGVLMAQFPIQNVILIDFATFLVALLTLLIVRIPNPKKTAESSPGQKKSLLREAAYGWSYLRARSGLVALLLFFAAFNLTRGMAQVLFMPLVLSFGSTVSLGTIMAIGGTGMLLGSLVMSAWGGPTRRVRGVLGLGLLYGVFIALFGIRPFVPLFAVAAFFTLFIIPILSATNQVIWQTKIAPEVQGRVFATRSMLAWSTAPIAYLIAGPLADNVFEPLMAVGSPLANSLVGQIIGVGPGRGIGLMYIVIGLLPIIAATAAYLYPRLRLLEDELPDAIPATPSAAAATD